MQQSACLCDRVHAWWLTQPFGTETVLQVIENTISVTRLDVIMCPKSLHNIQVRDIRVCKHVIAVCNENKLQHYATACRNHKSADEKLGLFRFYKFLCIFSANTLQPVQKSPFNRTATRFECSWQTVAYLSHVRH